MRRFFISTVFCAGSIFGQSEVTTDQAENEQYTKPKTSPKVHCLAETMPYYYAPNENYVYFFGEYLYWKAVTGDPLNWEMRKNAQIATVPQSVEEHMKTLTYDFSSGIRAGLGIRLKKDCWDNSIPAWQFESVLTHIYSAGERSDQSLGLLGSGDSEYLYPVYTTFDSSFTSSGFHLGHASIHLNQYRLDNYFAWPIWVTENTILRLFAGSSFAWFHNRLGMDFVPEINPFTIPPLGGYDNVHMEWKWWGGGLMGGQDIYLPIGCGLGLFANSSFGLLFGPMKLRERERTANFESFFSPDDYTYETKYEYYTFQPVVSFGIGTDYKKWIYRTLLLHLAVSWEFNWWFGLNQFGNGFNPSFLEFQYSDSLIKNNNFMVGSSGLGYQGLNVRLGFDY